MDKITNDTAVVRLVTDLVTSLNTVFIIFLFTYKKYNNISTYNTISFAKDLSNILQTEKIRVGLKPV